MKNKEIIDKLTDYFIKEGDPQIVARILAGMMIDFNRILHFHELPDDEKTSLVERMRLNNEELMKFAREGGHQPLKLDTTTFISS